MKRGVLCICLIIFLASTIWARGINRVSARATALNWMRLVPQYGQAIYLPKTEMMPILDKQRTTIFAYVLELEPKGFIIIAPDDQLQPILGFSFESKFDTTDTPENHLLLLIRQEMPLRLQALRENAIDAQYRQQAAGKWQSLSSSSSSMRAIPASLNWIVEIGPFVPSHWGQDNDIYGNWVYNYWTPRHYYCGCVATALSQMLYYHRWPDTGTDDHTYQWNDSTITENFGATTYDWANMVDNYYSPGDEPENKRQAAGRLTLHAGVAVDMDYTSSGSGALSALVAPILQQHFRHNGDWVVRSAGDFFTRLYNNMLLNRPATLSIRTSTNEGHAVVVDGVRHEGDVPIYYHLNYGWDGYVDSWFDLSGPWSAGGYNWTTIEGAIMDVLPVQDLNDPGAKLYSGDFSLDWSEGPNFSPAAYEVQQAKAGTSLTNFSDGAESGTGNWIIEDHWKQSSSQRLTGSYSFKGYIAETVGVYKLLSTMELDRTIMVDANTQISYFWGAYYFDGVEARFEISTDEKDWTPLRIHTSTAKKLSITWYQVTIPASELATYVGQTVLFRFAVRPTGSTWYLGTSTGFFVDDFSMENGYVGPWISVDNNITARSKAISVAQSGDYAYRVRGSWNGQWWPWSDIETVAIELPASGTLQVSALLDGPYNGSGTMRTELLAKSLIPTLSPYSQAPATADPIPANAVDWILLQLYESDSATVAKSRSLFLRNDGQLMDETGSTNILITGLYNSRNYYLVLKHRNHVRVMSAATINFSSGSAAYNFTDNINKYYGSGGAKSLATGVWGLWAGDVDQDGSVLTADFTAWQTTALSGATGYDPTDLRLDGLVTSADYVHWYENNRAGATTAMPNP